MVSQSTRDSVPERNGYWLSRSRLLLASVLLCVGVAAVLLIWHRNANTLAFRKTYVNGKKINLEIYRNRDDSVYIRIKGGGSTTAFAFANADETGKAEILVSEDRKLATFRYGDALCRFDLEERRIVAQK